MRVPGELHDVIRGEIELWGGRGLETFLFMMLTRTELLGRTLYVARSVVTLAEDEVVRQPYRTYPTPAFCRSFYGALRTAKVFEGQTRIAAIHSHPFCRGSVAFSHIDRASFDADRPVFARTFGGMELVAIVFDRDAGAFDGAVIHPHGVEPVDELQVIGNHWRAFGRIEPSTTQEGTTA